ncbi:MAG: hypothetical protein WBN72_08455, partial [Nitrososphaeraceae archaeon]
MKDNKESFNSPSLLVFWINMNKDKVSIITCLLIFVVAAGGSVFVNNAHVNKIAFAVGKKSKFNEDDFMIKDFGIGDDGNPFLA